MPPGDSEWSVTWREVYPSPGLVRVAPSLTTPSPFRFQANLEKLKLAQNLSDAQHAWTGPCARARSGWSSWAGASQTRAPRGAVVVCVCVCVCVCVFFIPFLGPLLWHVEIPRLGVESELEPPAYTTATATGDPSHVCNLHHRPRQHWILNPLSKARDRTCNLMVPSLFLNHCATMGTPVCVLSPVRWRCDGWGQAFHPVLRDPAVPQALVWPAHSCEWKEFNGVALFHVAHVFP